MYLFVKDRAVPLRTEVAMSSVRALMHAISMSAGLGSDDTRDGSSSVRMTS